MSASIRFLKWLVVFILLTIVLSEVIFRVLYGARLDRWETHLYEPDSILGYRYQPGKEWTMANIAYTNKCIANSMGFPGKEFNAKKNNGVYRIMIVGHSDDTGFNTNGPFSYTALLGQYFEKSNYPVEVINCAVDGRDRGVRNIELIRKELINYEPNLILMRREFPLKDRFRYRVTYRDTQINYLYWDEIRDAEAFIDDIYIEMPFCISLYDWMYTFRYMVKYYMDRRNDKDKTVVYNVIDKLIHDDVDVLRAYVRKEVYWQWEKKSEKEREIKEYSEAESLKLIRDLTEAVSKKGIQLVLFDTYERREQSENFDKLFAQHEINYIPLNVPFRENYSFGEHDGHSSQDGHRAIADRLYTYLLEIMPADTGTGQLLLPEAAYVVTIVPPAAR